MKLAKISLATVLALGTLSSVSSAKSLEEAIKGVEINGYLRYRYDGDDFTHKMGKKVDQDAHGAKHKYRVLVNTKVPATENVAFNLGVLYINEDATTNVGGGSNTATGKGLGAGEDGDFGVNTFYATFTPDGTDTSIMIGKQLLDTPLTDASDFDRGVGILALNKDVPNWTFALGAFDTIAPHDVTGYNTDTSVAEATYVAAAIAKYDELMAQAWYFHINDLIDQALYANLSYKLGMGEGMGIGLNLAYARNEVDGKSTLWKAGSTKNDLYKAQLDLEIKPVKITAGYLGNSEDGFSALLDQNAKGMVSSGTMGQLWWHNGFNAMSFSPLKGSQKVAKNQEDSISVLYANLGWDITNSLKFSAIYAQGEAKFTAPATATVKREFQEITPMITYKHTKSLSFFTYYAMLQSKRTGASYDEDRNRFRFQTLYRF